MKYLLLRNKIEIKRHILKYYVLQIILLLTYLIINKSSIQHSELKDYSAILGLNSINKSYIMYTLIKITSYLVIFHLTVKVFAESILKNIQYIMLRLNNKKWILYEMINFIIYITLMRVIYNIILVVSFKILGVNISFFNYLILFLKDLFFSIDLLLLTILSLNLYSYSRKKQLLTVVPIAIIIISLFLELTKFFVVEFIGIAILLIILNILLFLPSKFYTKYYNE